MSATFVSAVQALNDNADLRRQVLAAGSAEERAALLREAGVDVPTQSDVNSGMSNMADVSAAGNASTASAAAGAVECAAACSGL